MNTPLILHQSHHTLADFSNILNELKQNLTGKGLHLFPEMHLSGYPLKDLVLHKTFSKNYQQTFNELNAWLRQQPETSWRALIGGLQYSFSPSGDPTRIENVIFEAVPGMGMRKLYVKQLLPSYGIFDDKRYFSPGVHKCFYSFEGMTFGLLICEDMWHSISYDKDPLIELLPENLDGIINLSASPFDFTKHDRRLLRAKEISRSTGCPFIYVNRVGGEDEVLFDGRSFIVNGEKLLTELRSFSSDTMLLNFSPIIARKSTKMFPTADSFWKDFYHPRWDENYSPPRLRSLSDSECELILTALSFGLQEYARKNSFNSFLLGLSGGIDSAVVLTIAYLSKKEGQKIEVIYMPSEHSSELSLLLAKKLCKNLNLKLMIFPIEKLHDTFDEHFGRIMNHSLTGIADENIQSRLRGNILYTRSNQTGAMVLNTSNKSEIAVGYSTLYGDSVGALSVLGDLYKTDVYRIAEYINARYGDLLPEEIIKRQPTAELRPDQTDQQSLPLYPLLDAILDGLHLDIEEMVEKGFERDQVKNVFRLYNQAEYKRHQFCPILKVQPNSFGFGHRMPISKV